MQASGLRIERIKAAWAEVCAVRVFLFYSCIIGFTFFTTATDYLTAIKFSTVRLITNERSNDFASQQ